MRVFSPDHSAVAAVKAVSIDVKIGVNRSTSVVASRSAERALKRLLRCEPNNVSNMSYGPIRKDQADISQAKSL